MLSICDIKILILSKKYLKNDFFLVTLNIKLQYFTCLFAFKSVQSATASDALVLKETGFSGLKLFDFL